MIPRVVIALLAAACGAPPDQGAPRDDAGGDPAAAGVDTDGDGIPDEVERRIGSDPARADSDGDGIDDLAELMGRAPDDAPDCDGDGRPDAIEPATDGDGDGVPDFADPSDAPFCPGGAAPRTTGDPGARCPVFVCPDAPGDAGGGEGEGEAVPPGGTEGEGDVEGPGAEGEGEGDPCPARGGGDATCDGVDDDCDGRTDEDFAAAPCGVGVCQGVTECVGGDPSCNGARPSESDADCNGLDDDCDGQADEGWVPDASCGVGECRRNNTPSTCRNGVETACVPGLPVSADDANCNGRDEDCDGVADEDFAQLRCGVGVCATTRTCVGGQDTCALRPRVSNDDATCDGLDDNCNAQPDEDYVPVVCGLGECASMTFCQGGGVVCPETPPVGDDADCDGLDQDCDGQADNHYVGVACGVGACATTTVCRAGEVVCPDLPHPAQDVTCDRVDDDCDGLRDEDYAGRRCGEGVCAAVTLCRDGVEECPEGEPQGGDNDCDGIDDDCDGRPDNHYVGERCGVGACATDTVCVGAQVVCPDLPRAVDDRSCDGVDNDCDGAVDEDYRGQACGVGACAAITRCDPRGQVVCPPIAPGPNDAVCDNVDSDCDGVADEDYVGTPCGVGACATTTVCVRGAVRCPAVPHPDQDLSCNGEDNDCDGVVDDDFQRIDCSVGECEARTRCLARDAQNPPRVTCELPGHPPQDTRCDGLDEDCDGRVDEDWVEVPCGRPGVCAGRLRCRAGGTVCEDERAPTGDDRDCDGLDDDCDGQTDEGYFGVACQAESADGNLCTGRFGCVRAEEVCLPDGGPVDPTCDGVDDDCDGELDEDYPADPCRIGTCAGETVCDGGELFCEQIVLGADRTCDGCDDDNNGRVDDGYVPGDACEIGGSTCAAELVCRNAVEVCRAVVSATDSTCDNCDDDGDGAVDEGYVPAPCVQADGCVGTTLCADGEALCGALAPGGRDATCDGCDDDADGRDDEDWNASANCSIGPCPGRTACLGGGLVCLEGRPGLVDSDCDGCDEDGDGLYNEHYARGGECQSPAGCQGHWECRNQVETCVGGGLANDDTCDGCDDDGDARNDEDYLGGAACTTDANCAGETACVGGDVVCLALAQPPALDDDCDGVDDDCDGVDDEDCLAGTHLGWMTLSGLIVGTGCRYQGYDAQGWPRDFTGDGWADCLDCTKFSTCNGNQPAADIFAFETMDQGVLFGLQHGDLDSIAGVNPGRITLHLDGLERTSHCSFNDARGARQHAAEYSGGTGSFRLDGDDHLADLTNITMAWFYESPNDCANFGSNNQCLQIAQERAGKSLGMLEADVEAVPGAPANLARDLGARIVMQIGSLNPPGPFGHCTQPGGGQQLPCGGWSAQNPCVDGCGYDHVLQVRVLGQDHGATLPAGHLELPPYGNRSNVGIQSLASNADMTPFEGDAMWNLPRAGWFAMPARIGSDPAKLRFRYGLLYDEYRWESCFQTCFQGQCFQRCNGCPANIRNLVLRDEHGDSQVSVTFNSCHATPVLETHLIKWCAHPFHDAESACANTRGGTNTCTNHNFGCEGVCGGGQSFSGDVSYCRVAHGTDAAGAPELHLADDGPGGGCGLGAEVPIVGMDDRAGYFLFRFLNGVDAQDNMVIDDLQLISP